MKLIKSTVQATNWAMMPSRLRDGPVLITLEGAMMMFSRHATTHRLALEVKRDARLCIVIEELVFRS